MSSWDRRISEDEAVEEFFEELDDLEDDELFELVESTVKIALLQADPGDMDYSMGLGAASLVAIWHGAPYALGDLTDRFSFIRGYIGQSDNSLTDSALELLDQEMERLDDQAPEGLETYVEALS